MSSTMTGSACPSAKAMLLLVLGWRSSCQYFVTPLPPPVQGFSPFVAETSVIFGKLERQTLSPYHGTLVASLISSTLLYDCARSSVNGVPGIGVVMRSSVQLYDQPFCA